MAGENKRDLPPGFIYYCLLGVGNSVLAYNNRTHLLTRCKMQTRIKGCVRNVVFALPWGGSGCMPTCLSRYAKGVSLSHEGHEASEPDAMQAFSSAEIS